MEAYYNSVHLQSNNSDYAGLHTATSHLLPSSFQKSENIGEIEAGNLLNTSILMANGIDASIATDELLLNHTTWATSSAHSYPGAYQHNFLNTPPPEGNGFPPSYSLPSWQTYGLASNQLLSASCMTQPITNGMQSFMHGDSYVLGSSLDESPLSSPSSCEEGSQSEEVPYVQNQNSMYGMTQTAGYDYVIEPTYGHGTVHLEGQEPHMGMQVPMGVKMPQRKGGIQLWQFLYSLLTSTESKHREIIEWTSNIHEREFRMLEPESIAVWWGHHKNKPNMSYDKFSRSLRYYYDKGILKKIPGERYVYRFLIDPEHMYRYIGTSDCRPKLKPMPQAAKVAMSKNQHDSNIDFKTNIMPIITQDPEPLEKKFNNTSSNVKTPESIESARVDGVLSAKCHLKSSKNLLPINSMIQNSSSMGNLVDLGHETGSLSMKRSRSLEYASTNRCERSSKQIALSNDSTNCPPTLRSSFESLFPNDLREYSHTQCIASQDAFASSQRSISEPLYVTAVGQSKQMNMPQKHYYSQPKSDAEFANFPISLQPYVIIN